MGIRIFEFIRDLIYKESLFLVDDIADLGFVEIIFVVCINLDVLWAMNGLDFIFLWVPCIILIFLKGVFFFFLLILKFVGGPYGFKKKGKSANEEIKPVFFFFIILGANK